ncbi:hypothetical protein [Chitinophaga sp. HK235]|uniref:hypothetical protein n=1 Tax=Chitinophaga sp. HK235 TaxID=2952571 RepID=UPI001BAD5B7D|nr:hypothetical protein [Chitinophaga sp. HK235]
MFILNSKISIGQYGNIKPIEAKITRSIFDLVDKATLTIPKKATVMQGLIKKEDQVNAATLFKAGDAVSIELGYNEQYRTEFKGFVTEIDNAKNVVITCEGFSYKLRNKNFNEQSGKTSLKDLLQKVIAGTGLTLADDIPGMVIDKWELKNVNGLQVLMALKAAFPLELFFDGEALAVNLLNRHGKVSTINLRMGYNVISNDQLKYKKGPASRVTVKVTSAKKDGTAATNTASSSENKSARNVTDKTTLDDIGKKYTNTTNYEGYEGKITCFLQPYIQPGDTVYLEDLKFNEKTALYYVQSTAVTYGPSKANREITISQKK